MDAGAIGELFLGEPQSLALAPHRVGEALSEVAHGAEDRGLTAMGLQAMSDIRRISRKQSPGPVFQSTGRCGESAKARSRAAARTGTQRGCGGRRRVDVRPAPDRRRSVNVAAQASELQSTRVRASATMGSRRWRGLCGSGRFVHSRDAGLDRYRSNPAGVEVAAPLALPDHHVLDEQTDEGALLAQVEAIPAISRHALEGRAVEVGVDD